MTKDEAEEKARALTAAGVWSVVIKHSGRPGGYQTATREALARAHRRYNDSPAGLQRNIRSEAERRGNR